jgi:hypothetical protein
MASSYALIQATHQRPEDRPPIPPVRIRPTTSYAAHLPIPTSIPDLGPQLDRSVVAPADLHGERDCSFVQVTAQAVIEALEFLDISRG